MLRLAGADLGVQRIHAAGMHPHQHLPVRGNGTRNIDRGERSSGLSDNIGAHQEASARSMVTISTSPAAPKSTGRNFSAA